MTQEPDWKDKVYIGKMLILYHASLMNIKYEENYPYYYKKHLSYLKDVYPTLFFEKNHKIKNEIQVIDDKMLNLVKIIFDDIINKTFIAKQDNISECLTVNYLDF